MLFRGYGFQVLVSGIGAFATILPVAVLFGLAHSQNLNFGSLALVNTILWGVVLGYAFLRSGDLWLPIGLHFGWNWALPLLGVNLSGFTMDVTGYAMQWRTAWRIGGLWSGGAYGPEGGLLTTAVAIGLFFYVREGPDPASGNVPAGGHMIRKRLRQCIFLCRPRRSSVVRVCAPPAARAQKLTEDDRVEILRGLLSEYATVKALSSALQEAAAV